MPDNPLSDMNFADRSMIDRMEATDMAEETAQIAGHQLQKVSERTLKTRMIRSLRQQPGRGIGRPNFDQHAAALLQPDPMGR